MDIEIFDIGDEVVCDLCSKDFSTSDESGGFLFMSKGVGPCCAEKFLQEVKRCKEEKYIESFCPENKSFREYILVDVRKGNNTVTFIGGE